jgi:metal-responsive CopG/Arc/MetJ family transcriptional regulator
MNSDAWRKVMAEITTPVRKLTISLPIKLADFLDREAARLNVSRSRLIARALSEARLAEEERLAAEGYLFYAQEASEFAHATSNAVAEALEHAG